MREKFVRDFNALWEIRGKPHCRGWFWGFRKVELPQMFSKIGAKHFFKSKKSCAINLKPFGKRLEVFSLEKFWAPVNLQGGKPGRRAHFRYMNNIHWIYMSVKIYESKCVPFQLCLLRVEKKVHQFWKTLVFSPTRETRYHWMVNQRLFIVKERSILYSTNCRFRSTV